MKLRSVVVGAFAVSGAIVAAVSVPYVLDLLFDWIKHSSGKPAPEAATVKQFKFRKVVFDDAAMEGAKAEAQEALTRARTSPDYLVRLCEDPVKGVTCDATVQLSEEALKLKPEWKPLAGMSKIGSATLVQDDRTESKWSVYQFLGVESNQRTNIVDDNRGYPESRQPMILLALALVGAIFGGGVGNLAINASQAGAARWYKMETGDRVNLFLGIVAGIICSLPFLIVLGAFGPVVAALVMLGLTLGFGSLSVYALNSMEEVLPWKKGEIRGKKSGIKILDTNVLIDGRIYDLLRTGFLEGELYVPKFVLQELQYIADSADALRRQRGRRGLDVLRLMQADHPVEVGSLDRHAGGDKEDVDSRLVKLAKAIGGDLLSNDYNLNRVASIQDVRVLNINDLALALRPNILPGESMELTINREGNQPGQGVGYLEDGTMVVVEGGRTHIGETLEIQVTQVIQTERGKMIFGVLPDFDTRHPNGGRSR